MFNSLFFFVFFFALFIKQKKKNINFHKINNSEKIREKLFLLKLRVKIKNEKNGKYFVKRKNPQQMLYARFINNRSSTFFCFIFNQKILNFQQARSLFLQNISIDSTLMKKKKMYVSLKPIERRKTQ